MRRLGALILSGALVVAACSDNPLDRSSLAVPMPNTAQLEPSLRDWLLGVHADVEQQLANPNTTDGDLAAAFGDYGQVLHAFDLRDAAREAYDQAAKLAPQEFRWPYFSGRVSEFLGDVDQAKEKFRNAVALDSKAAHAWVRLGDVQRASGDTRDALASYSKALALSPSAEAYFGLGQIRLALNDEQEAIMAFRQALRLQPSASAIRVPLSQAIRASGEIEEADRQLQLRGRQSVVFDDPTSKALGEVRLLAAYQALLSMAGDEDTVTADELLGFALTQFGDVQGSQEVLVDDLGELEKTDDPDSRRLRARLHYALGGLRVYLDRDSMARGNFLRSLELDVELISSHLKLGNLEARAGKYLEAVGRYDHVLAARPNNVEALLKRGTALLNLGKTQEARDALNRVVGLDPSQATAYVRLAEASEIEGDLARALEILEAATEQSSDSRGVALIQRGLAEFFVRHQQLDRAITALLEGLQQDRTLTSSRFRLADLLAHMGRYSEAIEQYQQVIADQPSNPAAHLRRAAAMVMSQDPAGAIATLEVAAELLPDNGLVAHQLARLLVAESSARDEQRALDIMTAHYTDDATSEVAVTMGMIYAELGRFKDAEKAEMEAVSMPFHRQRLSAYQSENIHQIYDLRELLVIGG